MGAHLLLQRESDFFQPSLALGNRDQAVAWEIEVGGGFRGVCLGAGAKARFSPAQPGNSPTGQAGAVTPTSRRPV